MTSFRFFLAVGVWLGVAAPAAADEVVVFAAASLKEALDQVAHGFEQQSGHQVRISYAASNTLARQIVEGAPADLFLSAAVNWMDEVEKTVGLAARQDLLGNSMVLVSGDATAQPVALDAGTEIAALLQGGKLSMALVDAVPAGQYGKAALTALGQWDRLALQVAQSDNVRAALRLVALGEAPLGVVYATDAAAEPGVTVLGTFPADSHPAIVYPAALLKTAADPADLAFYQALSSAGAAAIFRAAGFRVHSHPSAQ